MEETRNSRITGTAVQISETHKRELETNILYSIFPCILNIIF